MSIILRSCGVCGGHWSGYSTGDTPGGAEMWLCPKHREAEMKRWAAWVPKPQDSCHDIQHQSGPFSDLFVISVDGDEVTVGVLGFPGRTRVMSRHNLVPARY